MNNDRKITITTGASRKSTTWLAQTLYISELYEKLSVPVRGTETQTEYFAMKKDQQAQLKDVGGFVAGTLRGQRRKGDAVTGRDVLTLDMDNLAAGSTEDFLRRLEGLGCGYCVYSTRKHTPGAPRLRVLFPLDRTVTVDEYEPCARRIAHYIDPGMTPFDPTTFEASRLMYWPSCSADAEYIYQWADKPLLSADGLLATFADWRDMTDWPQVPGAQINPKQLSVKQGDPTAKSGVVGAFCRTYDIYGAMDAFLPGLYEPVDSMPGRYTFTGGTTTGGAVVYDEGKFLYSHHATDPCSGKLVNAFDLVRLNLYDDLDVEAKPETPVNKLPSYLKMTELAMDDDQVKAAMREEQFSKFDPVGPGEIPDNTWMEQLELKSQSVLPKSTIDNIWIILENDPELKGKFALNEFAGRGEVLGALPWNKSDARRAWQDSDNQGLYWYLEKVYGITGTAKIDGALALHSNRHAFNEVKDYLNGLIWDGVPRLDRLFIDYLGAEDTPYTRAVTRKAFTAAAARALTPGTKFDCMTILSGRQGIGKSTLLDHMSKGWFNDSIRSFEGKEASELLQGVWLVEISELDAFRKTDVARIKQFLSLRADRFRAAYGRHVKECPRCCVFFGTTNSDDYLQDKTGNRRFWPVDVGLHPAAKSVWRDLDQERDQLWAEAVIYYRLGEPLYLTGEIEAAAQAQQEEHREISVREGPIVEFLSKPVPRDWSKRSQEDRIIYWNSKMQSQEETMLRDRVCALEIWCELFQGTKKDMKYADAQEINAIISKLPEWEKSKKTVRFGCYGTQKGFIRRVTSSATSGVTF